MLLLFPFWLVLFAIVVGWGLLVHAALDRASAGRVREPLTAFQTAWLGYAGLLAFLLLWAFVLPIDRLTIPFGIVPAIAGYVLQRELVVRRLRAAFVRPRIAIVIAVLIAMSAIVVAWTAADSILAYDTNLYHLQVVKWNASYSAVPGLANLHMRFGYDNSVHLFDTYVDAYWQGMAAHVANGFLLATLLAQWIVEILTARTPRGRVRQMFCLLTLPFVISKLWTSEVASLSSDLPLGVFACVLVLELVSLRRRSLGALAYVVTIGAVATTTKLGGLGLFVPTMIAALVFVGRRAGWRAWLVVFGFPGLIVALWIARNVVLTGWLIFPVFGKLPVSWAVPHDLAEWHLRWIQSWARVAGVQPEEALDHGFFHWFRPWFDFHRQSREFVLFISSVALIAWRLVDPPARSPIDRAALWTAIAAIACGMVQWFVGAPDLRFGGFLFWLLPALLFTSLLGGAMRDSTTRAFVCAIALVACAWGGAFTPRMNEVVPPLWGRMVSPKRVWLVSVPTGPNTVLYRPTDGDQCFDTPLPCTPEPRTTTLRDPNSLGKGFNSGPSR